MKRASWQSGIGGIAFLAISVLVGCGGHSSSTHAVQDDALTALKSLRDRGVLSQDEYDAKVATLQGGGSAGLGNGDSLGGNNAGASTAARSLGEADSGAAGLASGGNEFAAGPPAASASESQVEAAAPQSAPRAVHNRLTAPGDSPAPDRALAPQNANARASAMRTLLAQARAKQAAMARSAHDLALRMLDRATHANPPAGQRTPTPQDAQAALQSYGQALLHGGDPSGANAGNPADQDFSNPPRQR